MFAWMLAQAATQPVNEFDVYAPLIGGGGGLASLGVVIWIVRHLLTVTIPNLTEAFRKESQENRDTFMKALDQQCKQSQSDFQQQRLDFKEMLSQFRADFVRHLETHKE